MFRADTPRKMSLQDHVLMRYRLWRNRREWRKSDMPGFYRRARPSEVEGLAIQGDSWTVGDFLPVGFEAYVRLPNPFWKVVAPNTEGAIARSVDDCEDGEVIWVKPLRHSEVAEANGLRMTHDTHWAAICGPHERHLAASPNQVWNWGPHEGNIEPFVAQALFRRLASETGPDGRCLCGQWEGGSNGWETDTLLVTRGWNYFVWRARLQDVAAWLQRPNSYIRDRHVPHIVWPAHRKWCLATLYSGHSNYLAGSRAMIDWVLSSELEAYSVALTDRAR